MANHTNVIFITTHDSGRHFGCYGIESAPTPHIDALSADGCRLDGMFSTCPVCSPARASMMTGRHPQHNGMLGLAHDPFSWRMHADERHLSHILREAGYQTALIGHYHETMQPEQDLAFDHISHYLSAEPRGLPYSPAAETVAGVGDFLDHTYDPQRPLFLQIGFFETHTPFSHGGATPDERLGVVVPEPAVDNSESRAHFAALQGALQSLDAAIDTLLGHLDQHGLRENTLLVFTTDHGVDWSPYLRAKHSLYDRGIEIASLWRLPGRIPAGSVDTGMHSNIDVLPTVLELLELPLPDHLDGRSFAPQLTGRAQGDAETRPVFAEYSNDTSGRELRCIRTDTHKLILSFAAHRMQRTPVDFAKKPGGPNVPHVECFALQEDPHELHDLAQADPLPPVVSELQAQLVAWLRAVGDPVLDGPVVTPYYRTTLAGL